MYMEYVIYSMCVPNRKVTETDPQNYTWEGRYAITYFIDLLGRFQAAKLIRETTSLCLPS